MKTIYATLHNLESADRALTKFAALNFDPKEISIIVREDININVKPKTEAGQGAATGAVVGGIAGGVAGLLLGIGAITIAGLSPLLIAGPLAAALGITTLGAATVEGAATGIIGGGLVGALVGLGIPKETAQKYEAGIREGEVLLGIPVKDSANENIITKVLQDENAENIYILGE